MRQALCWVLLIVFSTHVFAQDSAARPSATSEAGFVPIFDGRSLTGWSAVPENTAADWSVRDGAIVGIGSQDRQIYLVWKDHELADFELKFQYRLLTDGNTGVEIRANPDATLRRPFQGYHVDIGHVDIGPNVLGAWDFHFGKQRREHACPRGTSIVIDEQDQARSTVIANSLSPQDVRVRDWNDVHVVAKGNHGSFSINGKFASAFTDNFRPQPFARGAIGLQLHERGMRVEFRNLRIKSIGKD